MILWSGSPVAASQYLGANALGGAERMCYLEMPGRSQSGCSSKEMRPCEIPNYVESFVFLVIYSDCNHVRTRQARRVFTLLLFEICKNLDPTSSVFLNRRGMNHFEHIHRSFMISSLAKYPEFIATLILLSPCYDNSSQTQAVKIGTDPQSSLSYHIRDFHGCHSTSVLLER